MGPMAFISGIPLLRYAPRLIGPNCRSNVGLHMRGRIPDSAPYVLCENTGRSEKHISLVDTTPIDPKPEQKLDALR